MLEILIIRYLNTPVIVVNVPPEVDSALVVASSLNGGSWKNIFKNIKKNIFFVRQLVFITIIGDLKRSALGLLWLFILPIFSAIVWLVLHGAGIIDPGNIEIPYPAYVLLSTSIWAFFSDIYKSTSNIIMQNSKVITMTSFPHELLILSKIIVHLINFSIPLLVNIVILYFFGIRFDWVAILFPLSLLPLLLMGLSIGLIVALFRVVAVDLSKMIDQAILFLMFLTPVVYSSKIKISWLSGIIKYNPMTYLIGFSRDLLTKGVFYEPKLYLLCSIITFVFFTLSIRLFLKAEPKIIEKLINN